MSMTNPDLVELEKRLSTVMSNERFLTRKGPGNDLPFYICDYPASWDLQMADCTQRLTRKLRSDGVDALQIDLFQLSIELLQGRNLWQRILDNEATLPREELLELLRGVLDAEAHLAPAIRAQLEDKQPKLLMLTGIGATYPFVRIHNLLTNLDTIVTNIPLVVFFPGTYKQTLEHGARLSLFDKVENDRYYRAFNIHQYPV